MRELGEIYRIPGNIYVEIAYKLWTSGRKLKCKPEWQ